MEFNYLYGNQQSYTLKYTVRLIHPLIVLIICAHMDFGFGLQ